jgi:hypothetical protein
MKKGTEEQPDLAAEISAAKGVIAAASKVASAASEKYAESVTKDHPGQLVRFSYSVWSAPSADPNAEKFHGALKIKEKAESELRELKGKFKAATGSDYDG